MVEENNDIINNEEEIETQEEIQEENTEEVVEDPIEEPIEEPTDNSVKYNEDTDSVRMIRDFYSTFSDNNPTDMEVDSIVSHYKGDNESIIRDLYKSFKPDVDLSTDDIESIKGNYSLKKKVGSESVPFISGLEGAPLDASSPISEWNYDPVSSVFSKNNKPQTIEGVPKNIFNELITNNNEEFIDKSIGLDNLPKEVKVELDKYRDKYIKNPLNTWREVIKMDEGESILDSLTQYTNKDTPKGIFSIPNHDYRFTKSDVHSPFRLVDKDGYMKYKELSRNMEALKELDRIKAYDPKLEETVGDWKAQKRKKKEDRAKLNANIDLLEKEISQNVQAASQKVFEHRIGPYKMWDEKMSQLMFAPYNSGEEKGVWSGMDETTSRVIQQNLMDNYMHENFSMEADLERIAFSRVNNSSINPNSSTEDIQDQFQNILKDYYDNTDMKIGIMVENFHDPNGKKGLVDYMNLQAKKDKTLGEIQSMNEKIQEIENKLKQNGELNDSDQKQLIALRDSRENLNNLISNIELDRKSLKENRGFGGNELYDMSGRLVDPKIENNNVVEDASFWQQQKNEKTASYTSLLRGGNPSDYRKIKDEQYKLYYKKKFLEDAYLNKTLTLPSGQKMTLKQIAEVYMKNEDDAGISKVKLEDYLMEGGRGEFLGSGYGQDFRDEYQAALKDLVEGDDPTLNVGISITRNLHPDKLQTLRKYQEFFGLAGGYGGQFPIGVAGAVGYDMVTDFVKKVKNPEDMAFIASTMINFREDYYSTLTSLEAVTEATTWNVDPGLIGSERSWGGAFLSNFAESTAESFASWGILDLASGIKVKPEMGAIATENDLIQNYYQAYLKSGEKMPFTKKQLEEGPLDISEMAGMGAGASLPIMLELVGTRGMAGGGLKLLKLKSPRYMAMRNYLSQTKAGKVAVGMGDDIAIGMVSFGMTTGDQVTWKHGLGEGFVEGVFNRIFKTGPMMVKMAQMYKKHGMTVPMGMIGARVSAGAGGQFVAEYSGEFLNNLDNTGFNWQQTMNKTFGATKDERVRNLGATAIVSLLFSSAFSMPSAYTMSAELGKMVDGTSDLVSEENGGPLSEEAMKEAQDIQNAIAEYIKSSPGQQLSLWNNMTLQEVLKENPESYSFIENIILQSDNLGNVANAPNYRVNGKDISKEQMAAHIMDPNFVRKVKKGDIDMSIHNDSDIENLMLQNFTKNKYEEYIVAKNLGPDKKGGKYNKLKEGDIDFRKYESVINKEMSGQELNTFDQAIKKEFEEGEMTRDEARSIVEKINISNQVNLENQQKSEDEYNNIYMPPSEGRQLNLFDEEGVRSAANVVSQVPAGSRLFNNPNPETTDMSSEYIANNGLNLGIQESEATPVTSINVENSKRIADAYDEMKHNPEAPDVKIAYEALAKETIDQYKNVINRGYDLEVYKGQGEPYTNSDEMIKDVRDNKHLYIFGTESGYGESGITDVMRQENPLLQPTEFVDVKGEPLVVNDLFRFVHDFFGHTEMGNGFGPIGEENAWLNHSRMFSDQAKKAMTTETRGQNSWVNFNKNLRGSDGRVPSKGDANYVKPQDRPFAEQKIGLLPDHFVFQQPMSKSIYAEDDGLNKPFKYNRSERVYRGVVNGVNVDMVRVPGEGFFIEKSTQEPLGVSKAQAIKVLQNKYAGIKSVGYSTNPDNTTTNTENTKEVLDVAMGNSEGTVGDIVVEAPQDLESLSDRIVRQTDEDLDNIARYGDRINKSVTMGLDLATYKKFLNTYKDNIKNGDKVSKSFDNALRSINANPETEMLLKGKYLYANDGVMTEARGLVRNGLDAKEFEKVINNKYDNSFSKDQISEMYSIAEQQVNPVIINSNYTASQNNSINSAQEKIQTMFEEGLAPLEISFNKNGYVNFDGEGNVVFKKYNWNFDKSPKLEGLKYEDKVDMSVDMLLQDYQNLKDLEGVQKSMEWYASARSKIEARFGSNSDLFIKLLAATSPNRTPKHNFQDASEALHMYSIGEYDNLLDSYGKKVNDINDRLQTGEITKDEAITLIKKASHNPDNRVFKSNGKNFGTRSVDGMVIRSLYGNWSNTQPGSKTIQFANNLSGRDKNATIDVWAARNLRKILYSGTDAPWRMRIMQESGVNKKDFDFAQAVYTQAADKIGLTPYQLQAAMWNGEKQLWIENGWTNKSGAPSYLSEIIPSEQLTDRVMLGASSYIGKDASKETIDRIRMVGDRAMEKARINGLGEDAVYIAGREAMNGEVRLDQAVNDIFEETQKLDPIAGRPTLGEGIYMNQAEPTIESEITIDKDADISGLVDKTIEIGHYSEQHSVFVSKIVPIEHPNARPFYRVEFTKPGVISKEYLSDKLDKTIGGATLTKNQRGEVTGFYSQFVPEYSGSTIESFADDSRNYQNQFSSLIESIRKEKGPKSLNQIEKNYVNTKVFNYAEYTRPDGQYRTIKESDRRFDTTIEKELQRAAEIDGRNSTQDIIDKSTGNENNVGSIWKNTITDRFARKLDQLEKDLDELMFADPLLIVPTIKAGIKVGKATLRATNNILKAIDAVTKYVRENKPKGAVFGKKQQNEIKNYFYEFAAVEEEGLSVDGESNLSSEKVLSKEELHEQEKNEDIAKVIDNTPLFRESGNIVYTDPDVVQAMYENLQIQEKAKNSPIRGNQFERIKHLLNEGNVLYMEEMSDVKFRVKDALTRISKRIPELDEASTFAIMELINWGQASGDAKMISGRVDLDLWKGGRMDKKDIDKVGYVNTLKRIIQLDTDYDEKKLMIDGLLDQVNSIEVQSIVSKGELDAMKKPKSKYAQNPEYQGKQAEIDQLVSSRDVFINELNNIYNFKSEGARMILKQAGGVWGLYNRNGEEIPKGLAKNKEEAPWRLHHTRYHPGAGVIDPITKEAVSTPMEIPGIDKDLQLNKEISEDILKGMKTEGSPQYMDNFSEINDISERYAEENRKILDMLLEEGLLNEEVHAEIRPKFYSKRSFADKILTRENNAISRSDRKEGRQESDHLDGFLKGLKAGDDGVLYMNPVRLLRQSIAASSYLKFENRARRALYEFIKDGAIAEGESREIADNIGADQKNIPSIRDIIGYIPVEGEGLDMDKYVEMSYMDQGERVNFVVTQDTYNSFFGTKKSEAPHAIFQYTTMPVNRVLRRFATGNLNPAFWITNTNLDFQNLTMFTEAYKAKGIKSLIPGLSQGQGTIDFANAIKDAWSKSEEYQKAVSQGMSLEWLSDYGASKDLETLRSRGRNWMSREEFQSDKTIFSTEGAMSLGTWLEAVNFLNQTSEIAGRLAARRRWIKNYTRDYVEKWGKEPEGWDLEKIERMATGQAVKNANFNQSGRSGKFIDQVFVPYFNAFMQIHSRGVDYIKNNPVDFGKTVLKASSILAGLAAYNMTRYRVKDEEKEEQLKAKLTEAQENEDNLSIKKIKKQIDDNRLYYYDYLTDYEKDNNMNIIFPEWFDDDQGNPFILKVRLDGRLNVLRVPFEESVYYATRGKKPRLGTDDPMAYLPWGEGSEKTRWGRALKKALPLEGWDPTALIGTGPLGTAYQKIKNNYDPFRQQKVWRGPQRIEGYNQYYELNNVEDKFLKDLSRKLTSEDELGRLTGGFNVEQWKSGLSSIATNLDRNIWYQMFNTVYVAGDDAINANPEVGKNLIEGLSGTFGAPFERFHMRLDTDQPWRSPKSQFDLQAEEAMNIEANDLASFKLAKQEAFKNLGVEFDDSGILVWKKDNDEGMDAGTALGFDDIEDLQEDFVDEVYDIKARRSPSEYGEWQPKMRESDKDKVREYFKNGIMDQMVSDKVRDMKWRARYYPISQAEAFFSESYYLFNNNPEMYNELIKDATEGGLFENKEFRERYQYLVYINESIIPLGKGDEKLLNMLKE